MDHHDDPQPAAAPAGRSRVGTGLALVAAGSLAGLVLGLAGLAGAAEVVPTPDSSTSTTQDGAAPSAATDDELCEEGRGSGPGGRGPGGGGPGAGSEPAPTAETPSGTPTETPSDVPTTEVPTDDL